MKTSQINLWNYNKTHFGDDIKITSKIKQENSSVTEMSTYCIFLRHLVGLESFFGEKVRTPLF